MNDIQLSLLNATSLTVTTSLGTQHSYVGVDLSDYYFDDDDLNHQFFNGALLSGCLFQSLEIKHTEIREATFSRCQFIDCDLTSSDLVYSRFDDCLLINCQLANGEWIESKFTHCNFIKSTFNHTTVNLNVFQNCSFDQRSFSGMNDQSVQFNIFENCRLEETTQPGKCIDRNFGIQGPGEIDKDRNSTELFVKISRQYFAAKLPTRMFILVVSEIIEQMLSTSEIPHVLGIKYLSLICRSYIESESVSPLGIQRLEKIITQKIQLSNGDNQGLYTELVQLIMGIRLQYGNRVDEVEAMLQSIKWLENTKIRSWEISFEKNYSEEQVASLQDYIASYCDISPESIKYMVHYGSTNIAAELLTKAPMYLSLLYGAYLSLLKAVELTTKTVRNVTNDMIEIRENVDKLSTLKQPLAEVVQPEVQNESSQNIQNVREKQNIVNVMAGNFKSHFARRTVELASNEKVDPALEMEDRAKLCVTILTD